MPSLWCFPDGGQQSSLAWDKAVKAGEDSLFFPMPVPSAFFCYLPVLVFPKNWQLEINIRLSQSTQVSNTF